MAKEQTRRSVSLNLGEFKTAAAAAKRCGISVSKYTEAALRVFHQVSTPELFTAALVTGDSLPAASKSQLAAAVAALAPLEEPPAVLARMEPELESRIGVLHPGGRPEPPPPPPAPCRLCRRTLSPAATARGDELCASCSTPAEDNPGTAEDDYRVVYDEGA